MAVKTKAPVEPKEPFYVVVKEFGLALKEGWAWLIYPLLFFLFCWFFNISAATIGTILSGLISKASSYFFKS